MTTERLVELAVPLLPPLTEAEHDYLEQYAGYLTVPGHRRTPPLPLLGQGERAQHMAPAIRRALRGLLLIDAE